MDRLARNLEDLRAIVRDLTGRGVRVEFEKGSLTFTREDSAMYVLLLSMLGAVAEFERSMILERQREGIAVAKAAGRYKGRKAALTSEQGGAALLVSPSLLWHATTALAVSRSTNTPRKRLAQRENPP